MQEDERGAGRRRAGERVVDRVPAERGVHVRRTRSTRPGTGSRRSRTGSQRRGDRGGCAARGRPAAPARAGRAGACGSRVGRRASNSGGISLCELRELVLELAAAPRRRPARSGGSRRASVARSSSSGRCAPSANRFSDGPAGSTASPRWTSRRSRQIDSRSIDKHVGAGRGPEAGRELLGDAGAADDVAALADDHRAARRSPGSSRRRGRCGRRRRSRRRTGRRRSSSSASRAGGSSPACRRRAAKIAEAGSINRLTAAPPFRSPLSSTRSLTAWPSMYAAGPADQGRAGEVGEQRDVDQQQGDEDARRDQRQQDPAGGRPPAGAEVERGLEQVPVDRLHRPVDRDHRVGQIARREHDDDGELAEQQRVDRVVDDPDRAAAPR